MKTTILFMILLLPDFYLLNGQDAGQISARAAGAIEFDAFEMAVTLEIHDNRGNKRTRQVAVATRTFGETTKTLIRFLSPADVKGTAMLVYEYETRADDMWIFMPALRRTRQVVSSERSAGFMGSEFTNADMGSHNTDDFNHKLLGSETVEEKDCWIVESVPKTGLLAEENGFSRMIAFIDKENYHTFKVEYYNLKNELHRVMKISDYRRQKSGNYFAFRMEVNNIQNKRKSVLSVDKFMTGSGLDESSFAVHALELF